MYLLVLVPDPAGAGPGPRHLRPGRRSAPPSTATRRSRRPRPHRGAGRAAAARFRRSLRRRHRGGRQPPVRPLRPAHPHAHAEPRRGQQQLAGRARRGRARGRPRHAARRRATLPFRLRSALVPVANIGSNLGFILFFVGLIFFRNGLLMNVGIVLYSAAVLFTLVTLPVEFNASRRAMTQLSEQEHPRGRRTDGGEEGLERRRAHLRGGRPHGHPAAGAAHPHQPQVVTAAKRTLRGRPP